MSVKHPVASTQIEKMVWTVIHNSKQLNNNPFSHWITASSTKSCVCSPKMHSTWGVDDVTFPTQSEDNHRWEQSVFAKYIQQCLESGLDSLLCNLIHSVDIGSNLRCLQQSLCRRCNTSPKYIVRLWVHRVRDLRVRDHPRCSAQCSQHHCGL